MKAREQPQRARERQREGKSGFSLREGQLQASKLSCCRWSKSKQEIVPSFFQSFVLCQTLVVIQRFLFETNKGDLLFLQMKMLSQKLQARIQECQNEKVWQRKVRCCGYSRGLQGLDSQSTTKVVSPKRRETPSAFHFHLMSLHRSSTPSLTICWRLLLQVGGLPASGSGLTANSDGT